MENNHESQIQDARIIVREGSTSLQNVIATPLWVFEGIILTLLRLSPIQSGVADCQSCACRRCTNSSVCGVLRKNATPALEVTKICEMRVASREKGLGFG